MKIKHFYKYCLKKLISNIYGSFCIKIFSLGKIYKKLATQFLFCICIYF